MDNRVSGILLHITSLPSKYGIGDLGSSAFKFVDWLNSMGQSLWQILPLGPVDYGGSPYRSYSAFAGNPLLIDLDQLVERKLISRSLAADLPFEFSDKAVNFPAVREYKEEVLRTAFGSFDPKEGEYDFFLEENEFWLSDYALFMALKNHFNDRPWNKWDKPAAFRERKAMNSYKNKLQEEIKYHKFVQYIFFSQWKMLKDYADEKGVSIIGDLPFFVDFNSSDVWKNPRLFLLDSEGNPSKVAGVPPDYFSETGQLWGNPLYSWEEMKKDDYLWWRERIIKVLSMVDMVRIDHFRGFEACWHIPKDEDKAVCGKWVKGPGEDFFETVESYLGPLPVIAEDLGYITSEVKALKNRFDYPGMEVLQFLFESGPDAVFEAASTENIVLFSGTHDNDTLLGWYKKEASGEKRVIKNIEKVLDIHIRKDMNQEKSIIYKILDFALKSESEMVIFPLQDILGLGSEARMNTPGTVKDNWDWRFKMSDITAEIEKRLLGMTEKRGRK